MFGLIYLFVIAAHLAISLWLIKLAVQIARAGGRPGWYYGLPVGLVMFSLLYWDLIPTHVVHRYYCISDGGFTVHKTLDEWKQENPGVGETLIPKKNTILKTENNHMQFFLNQRFIWESNASKHLLGIRKSDERIVDHLTGEILAQYIDIDTDIRALGLGPRNFRDYKVWLKVDSCELGKKMHKKIRFNDFLDDVKNIGSMNNGYN